MNDDDCSRKEAVELSSDVSSSVGEAEDCSVVKGGTNCSCKEAVEGSSDLSSSVGEAEDCSAMKGGTNCSCKGAVEGSSDLSPTAGEVEGSPCDGESECTTACCFPTLTDLYSASSLIINKKMNYVHFLCSVLSILQRLC